MIKIEINEQIEKFAEEHATIIKKSLLEKIDNILKDKEIKLKINKKSKTIQITQEYENFLNNLKQDLDELLKAKPKQLSKLKNKYLGQNGVNYKHEILTEIIVREYHNWTQRTSYNAYHFVENLGLKTCPYCNRSYTFTVQGKSGKLRPELDHYHPKAKYPHLAMSFYNLIPSCPTCNKTKSEEEIDISPYELKNDDFTFTYKPLNIDYLALENPKYNFNHFKIDITSKDNKYDENIKVFKLKELYEQHKDIVLDLLVKKMYYPESYIKELSTSFGFSNEEIYRYLLNNYIKDVDLHKRPLSKLTRDIAEELELLHHIDKIQ